MIADKINIREVEESDIIRLVGLLNQLGYDETADEIKNRIVKITKHKTGNVFVAEYDQGNIIGCVQAMIDTRLAGGTYGEVVSLVVDKSFRGKGIGKNLIEHAIDWIKSRGESRLRIRCNSLREETQEIYKHLGFVEKKSQIIFEKKI